MHFTYNCEKDNQSLCQGDLIAITDELKDVLREYHSYFLRDEYKYFLVLTQTCDLFVRNSQPCKSPYITLAAVRTYDDFIKKSAKNFSIDEVNGFKLLDTSNYEKYRQLLERLYNNNESEFFFLARDDENNIKENHVAYLKVSIALKSVEHYAKCVKAKVLELKDEFKAKLGWLVGQMYSRVGTKDWDKSIFLDMIKKDLEDRFIITGKEKLLKLKNEIIDKHLTLEKDSTAVDEFLKQIVIKSKYDEAMETIDDIINKTNIEDKELLIRKIHSNSKLRSIIK